MRPTAEILEERSAPGGVQPRAADVRGIVWPYRLDSQPVFVSVPTYAEALEGRANDCGLIAAMAEVALRHPDVIRAFVAAHPVDHQMPVLPNGQWAFAHSPDGSQWAADVEKYFATQAKNGYQGLGYFDPGKALQSLMGESPILVSPVTLAAVLSAWQAGGSVVMATGVIPYPNPVAGLWTGNHGYALIGANAAGLTVYDPGSGRTLTCPAAQVPHLFQYAVWVP